MLQDEEKLSPVQDQAISLLALGESITNVAEQLKLSRKTVSMWCNQNTAFQTALKRLQSDMFDQAAARAWLDGAKFGRDRGRFRKLQLSY